IDPQHYAPVTIDVAGNDATATVHGWEMYLIRRGRRVPDSGRELYITLFLHWQDGQWTLTKLDQVTMAERHQAAPATR
ncbi:MAG: hypothetical protein ACRDI2_05465, partial [Chloroflexota bacterium]